VQTPTHGIHMARHERGATLIELMMALVMLSIGLMAVSQLFPAGTRGQMSDKLYSMGNYYAQEKIEEMSARTWADAELSIGRHPAGAAVESLGTRGTWQRFYQVDVMAAPLDNLRKVTVTVNWTYQGNARAVNVTTFVRR
jgi:prepilin-type N-terminal cleavage/methylation domain-containing protein